MPRRYRFDLRPAQRRAAACAPWWQRLPAQLALAWLLAALVAAPTLGRLHQVLHGGVLHEMRAGHPAPDLAVAAQARVFASNSPPAAVAGDAARAAVLPGDDGLLARALTGHGPSGCLLLDQLALGDALHGATLQLPAAAPTGRPPLPPAENCAARHIAQFHARGPPAT